MTQSAELELRLIELLRKTVLRGAARTIDPSVPLGAGGLALDSLGLVEYLGAIEGELDVELTDEHWRRAGELSLADLAQSLGAR